MYENLIASTTVVSRRPSQHNSVITSIIIGQKNPRLPFSYTNMTVFTQFQASLSTNKNVIFSLSISVYVCTWRIKVLFVDNALLLKHGLQKMRRREDEIQKETANVTSMLRTGQRNSTMRKGLFVAVWENTDWLLDKTSFKLIQLSGTAKFNTYISIA